VPARAEADRRPDVRGGNFGLRFSISDTAKFGDVVTGRASSTSRPRRDERRCSRKSRTASCQGWIKEAKSGKKKYHKLLAAGAKHPIEDRRAFARSHAVDRQAQSRGAQLPINKK